MSQNTEFSGFISNLSMAKKLLIVPAIMFTAMLINAGITIIDAHIIEKDVNHVKSQAMPAAKISTKILENSYHSQVYVLQFLNTHKDTHIAPLKALQIENTELIKNLGGLTLTESQQEQLARIVQNNDKYYGFVLNKLVPKSKEAIHLINDITDKQAKIIIKDLHKLQENLDSETALVAANAIEHAQRAEVKLLIYTEVLDEATYQSAYKELKALRENVKELSQNNLSPNEQILISEIETAVSHFYQESKALKEDLLLLNQLITIDLDNITNEIAKSSHFLQYESEKIAEHDIEEAYSMAEQLIQTVEVSTIISVLISLILVIYISKKINAPINHLSKAIEQIKNTGDFKIRSNIHSKDEIGMMSETFDNMLREQSGAIEQIKVIMKHLSQGDFTGRIESNLQGDFLELKNSINESAKQLELTFTELNRVNHALANGDFDQHIDLELNGQFKETADSTNATIESLHAFVSETNGVMQQISNGNLSHRVNVDLPGELHTLKGYINNTAETVEKAITEIKTVAQAQANGDLSKTIKGSFNGDFNDLKTSINSSAIELNRIVEQIKQSAYTVQHAVSEVETASMDLSSRTQEQAASIEETAAALEEITATVSQHTDSTQHADDLIHETKEQSNSGIKVVEQAQHSMSKITESSEEIAEIISLIDSIAFQTNLLALNAAVEAARAGEHGRGFAVVASEVRSLAQKSAEAASSIKDIIETSVSQVKQGETQVKESGEMLMQINSSIVSITDMVEQVSNSSRQEKTGIDQINIAVAQIDQITQQNAALSEEASAAATQMLQETEKMMDTLSFFKSTSLASR